MTTPPAGGQGDGNAPEAVNVGRFERPAKRHTTDMRTEGSSDRSQSGRHEPVEHLARLDAKITELEEEIKRLQDERGRPSGRDSTQARRGGQERLPRTGGLAPDLDRWTFLSDADRSAFADLLTVSGDDQARLQFVAAAVRFASISRAAARLDRARLEMATRDLARSCHAWTDSIHPAAIAGSPRIARFQDIAVQLDKDSTIADAVGAMIEPNRQHEPGRLDAIMGVATACLLGGIIGGAAGLVVLKSLAVEKIAVWAGIGAAVGTTAEKGRQAAGEWVASGERGQQKLATQTIEELTRMQALAEDYLADEAIRLRQEADVEIPAAEDLGVQPSTAAELSTAPSLEDPDDLDFEVPTGVW
jgi:hypothetical protein